MGQKTHPIGLRLGIIRGWDSNWYGGKYYADKLIEDEKIRDYIFKRLPKAGISKVVIERTLKRLIITIHTAKPGIIIGRGRQEVEKLRDDIKAFSDKDVHIYVYEIKRPDLDARLVAENISQQLRARISFRRAMKQALQQTMRAGAEGIKIMCSGRLGGAEMARQEQYKEGKIPLQTLRSDIDYALVVAQTIYGSIGIKVWICKGEVFGKQDLSPQLTENRMSNDSGVERRPERRDRDRGRERERRDAGGGERRNRGSNRNNGGQKQNRDRR
jgi:small subunit ribosomal protein S3